MNDLIVVKVDKARMLLAEARDAGQAKKVADLARAAEIYAKRQKLSEEAIAYATAVKVDALTLMGEFLRDAPKAKGGQPYRSTSPKKEQVAPTLAEVGIDRKESSNAQALADLKAKCPELHEKVRTGEIPIARVREAKENGNPGQVHRITNPKLEARDSPGVRWARLFHDLYRQFNSIRDAGGLTQLSQGWSEPEKEEVVGELRRIADVLQEYARLLGVNLP